MRKIVSVIAIVMIVSSAPVRAEGIDSLVEVGKSMAEINAALEQETKTFGRVKKAIDSGTIKKGQSKDSIRAEYGEPVIINDDSATKREKWAYKPATSTFFEGIRIYLYFDDKAVLDEIKTLQ